MKHQTNEVIKPISTIPSERTGPMGDFINLIEPQTTGYLVLQPWDRGTFRDQDASGVDRIWAIGVRQQFPTRGGDWGTEPLKQSHRTLLTLEAAREKAAQFASDYVAVVVECVAIFDGSNVEQITPVKTISR